MPEVYVKIARMIEQTAVVKLVINQGVLNKIDDLEDFVECDWNTIAALQEIVGKASAWKNTISDYDVGDEDGLVPASILNEIDEDFSVVKLEENSEMILQATTSVVEVIVTSGDSTKFTKKA
ncbi:MAG: hypothetical protein WBB28_01680 [Crinalium sp.]